MSSNKDAFTGKSTKGSYPMDSQGILFPLKEWVRTSDDGKSRKNRGISCKLLEMQRQNRRREYSGMSWKLQRQNILDLPFSDRGLLGLGGGTRKG
jgi:hypothetical protein